jgi:osomolarity two-component system sensor histidine kinase TcsA
MTDEDHALHAGADLPRRLIASDELFRLLVDSVKDYAIFMLDRTGHVLTWNEGAARINGYSAAEIIGKHFSEFYSDEAKALKHPDKELELASQDGKYEEEGWRIRKDGSKFWSNVVITAVYDNGELIGFAKVTRDLTPRLLAEREREIHAKMLDDSNRELRKALETKTRFLSTISHEVRTPMTGIIGLTELLTHEDLGSDSNSIVKSIFESSKRLLQLLNNLLDASKMESGKFRLENSHFPVRAVLGDVRQLVSFEAERNKVDLTGVCDPKVPESIFGDELKTRQVLLNMVHNAVKFSRNGTVDVSVFLVEADDRKCVRFIVSDTGIGIKASDQAKIFEPFSQADDATKRTYGGIGLGLTISKQLVELMGGDFGFESEYGKGSTFWFQLPIANENQG